MMNQQERERQQRRQRTARQKLAFVVVIVVLIYATLQFHWLIDLNIQTQHTPSEHEASTLPVSSRGSGVREPGNRNDENVGKGKLLQWEDGCLSSAAATSSIVPPTSSSSLSSSFPKGIIVTMALAPKGNRRFLLDGHQQICQNLPNQWELFALPQGIDFLLLVQDDNRIWNLKRFTNCLGLKGQPNVTRTWTNINGTTLTTTSYNYTSRFGATSSSGTTIDNTSDAYVPPSIQIHLASTIARYPAFIRQNMTRLEDRKLGYSPGCSARLRYLNGCRWYTYEMLHLTLLQQQKYEYFIKMDYDVVFQKVPQFHILDDMRRKNAVFAHTAQYHPKGDKSCATGILDAIGDFIKYVNNNSSIRQNDPWQKSICSTTSSEIQRNADQYYGNFIIGSVEYFTNPWIQEFGKFLSEWPSNGYFKYKWGDQIFWHFALGLLLEDDFKHYVVDYTDLRCKPDPNCWYSVFDIEKFGPNASAICNNPRGIFSHTKSLDLAPQIFETFSSSINDPAALRAIDYSQQPLFQSAYKHCNP